MGPPEVCYHGLNGVSVPERVQYANIISLSMSNEVATKFAKGKGGTVETASKRGIVLHVQCLSMYMKSNPWIFADMRWISKFHEREWLMCPFGYTSELIMTPLEDAEKDYLIRRFVC